MPAAPDPTSALQECRDSLQAHTAARQADRETREAREDSRETRRPEESRPLEVSVTLALHGELRTVFLCFWMWCGDSLSDYSLRAQVLYDLQIMFFVNGIVTMQ